MIKKIKALINENRKNQQKIIELTQELDWANVYHDSIRGRDHLENLSLNIGRWAGNYAFFYVLNRILNDFKPNTILEFGLGESSKFIMSYLDNVLLETKHLIIEQDENWATLFSKSVKVSKHSTIVNCPLETIQIKGFQTNSYSKLNTVVISKFDLYIIDGPFGSKKYSRYDIVSLVSNFEKDDQFIIVLDDFNRNGEKETAKDLLQSLKEKGINLHTQTYSGIKSVLVIATDKYKYVTSL